MRVSRWKGRIQEAKKRAEGLKWDTLALYLAYRDKRVPPKAKIIIGIAVAYALSPIDLIPDFLPFIGYLDDLLLVPLGIGYAIKLMPKDAMEEYRRRARVEFSRGSPKSWKAAAVVVLIWIGFLALALFMVLKFLLRS